MEKIEIYHSDDTGWNVKQGDKYSDRLAYEEMVGVVIALTMPEGNRPCIHWMKKTEEQHKKANS